MPVLLAQMIWFLIFNVSTRAESMLPARLAWTLRGRARLLVLCLVVVGAVGSVFTGSAFVGPILASSILPDPSGEARFEGAVVTLSEASPLAAGLVAPSLGMSDGDTLLFLTIDLRPGWKTYWRLPGRFGLAPTWSWSQSTNVRAVHVHHPAPVLFDEAGGRSVGYDTLTVWPLVVERLDVAEPVDLVLSLSFGLCADLCIPENAQFRIVIDGESSHAGASSAPSSGGANAPLSVLAQLPSRLPVAAGRIAMLAEAGGVSIVGDERVEGVGSIYVLENAKGDHLVIDADSSLASDVKDADTAMLSLIWPHDELPLRLNVIDPGSSVHTYDVVVAGGEGGD